MEPPAERGLFQVKAVLNSARCLYLLAWVLTALNFLGLGKVKKRAFSRASDQASGPEAGSLLSLLSLLSVTLSCCLPLPSFSLGPSSTCPPTPQVHRVSGVGRVPDTTLKKPCKVEDLSAWHRSHTQ